MVQIEGVNTQEEVDWYLGKKIAYIYKAETKKNEWVSLSLHLG
ncbi:60S ribosomal protein L35a-4 [Bienertia sinuspersici]